ncbi:MAG: T9SS type A sorting domain-containing protein [Lentimicrobium sp.]|nr:T9SS type A sorting domain-containing protein [Lentimicrobium sp.]
MNKFFIAALPFLLIAGMVNAQGTRQRNIRQAEVTKVYGNPNETVNNSRETVCDTVRFPLPGEITYYYFTQPPHYGYVTGNNSYKDKVKAEFFGTFETGSSITGFVAEFAVARSNSNPDITFGIWDNSGVDGKPGAMVASATKPLASIVADVQNEDLTKVLLSEPFAVTGPYYIGVVLPTTMGDTVALWCRKHVEGYNGTAWDQWEDGTWYAFSDPDNWGNTVLTSMTLHPIVCKTLGISEKADPEASVAPNPSTGIVNIQKWRSTSVVELEIFSMSGKSMYKRSFPGAVTNFNIDLSYLPKGIYMLRLRDDKRQHNQKLLME